MLHKYITIFSFSIFLLFANQYIQYKENNKAQKIQQDVILLLQQCANNIKDSCSALLKRGIPDIYECELYECYLVGATLSANGDDKKAIPYLQKSCQSKEKLGCALLGLLYEMNGNTTDAVSTYNIACNNGDVIGCYNMGVLQYVKSSFNMGEHTALQSFTRACFMRYPQACFNLAAVYANYKKDFANSLYFFHIACDYGMTKACKNMQLLKDMGITLPPLQKKRGLYVRQTLEYYEP